MEAEQSYIDIYKNYRNVIRQSGSVLMDSPRDKAFDRFERMGFPTRRQETYKYTNLKEPFAVNYGMNLNRIPFPLDPNAIFKCEVPGINSYLFFVVNDTFYCTDDVLREVDELKSKGVLIGSLRSYAESHPTLLSSYYNKAVENEEDAVISFNTAFAQDGFFMYVPKGVVIEKPIQLINVMHAQLPMMGVPRNLIILEEAAQAKVLVCAHTLDDVDFLSNRVTEVFVGKNAAYEHYKLENTHSKSTNVGSLFIKQQEGSNVLVNDITLRNGITRNNIHIDLDGEHCETLLCGMAIGDGDEHIDNRTVINHNKPNCKSRELYKYVLNDKAVGAFAGKILVTPGAQKTEASQVNRNVCMTSDAKMYTQPQLEIYADDVKCSHGASTGQIDETALFYLRSRGISLEESKMLLMFAFVNDVIENIRIDALKDKIHLLVEKRFRGELAHCSGCSVCNK